MKAPGIPGRIRPLALAAGGIATLSALAVAARLAAGLIGGARGTLAGFLLIGAVFAGCGLASALRTFRVPRLTRPAPVRLPAPPRDCEPVKSVS